MVWILPKDGRRLSRERQGRLSDDPASYQERQLARQTAISAPMLMLFREEGEREDGWRGVPFWWPVIVAQANATSVVFAEKTARP